MKTLAIDYGKRNIGLAVSDEIGIIAMKLPGAKVSSDAEAVSKIKKIIVEQNIGQILVGITEKGEIRESINAFINELKLLIGLPIQTWNEDFSSIQSEQGRSKKFKKEKSHSEAARILLQEFLDSTSGKSK